MTDTCIRLMQTFEKIQREQMSDFPLLNNALSVAAVGFEDISFPRLGVLVSPWCMNLILLPVADEWENLKPGSKQLQIFPSGEYEFVVADASGIGVYQSCSLFSPMFQFADQEAAMAAARAALIAVLEQSDKTNTMTHQNLSQEIPVNPSEIEDPPHALSRREFLRGSRYR